MSFWKKVFFHSPVKYGVAAGLSIIVTLVNLYLYEFAKYRIGESIINSGIIITLIGLLILCAFYGAFDTFAYAFNSMRNRKNRKYEDLVEYSQIKTEQRRGKSLPYMPFIVVGIIVIIIGIIVTLLIK